MAEKLTDTFIRKMPAPEKGSRITYDLEVKGFGVRVTAKGAKSFVLNYRTRTGRERRYTIGSPPVWNADAARKEAARLKREIEAGQDPLAALEADRTAPTIADLCERYEADYLPRKRPSSQRDDKAMIVKEVLPVLKHHKVAEVTHTDIDALHRKITRRGAPYRANRVAALLSKMFSLAIRWGWRSDNPAKGVDRNQEARRTRYLSSEELQRLTAALNDYPDQSAANIVRLLLLTGARRGEVLAARWEQFDLSSGIWIKPGATTKQKTEHRVPLSAPARQLLADMRAAAGREAAKRKAAGKGDGTVPPYVFPGRGADHRSDLNREWREIAIAAGLFDLVKETDAKGKTVEGRIVNCRLHDLRHTYASLLASAGLSLPVIGALLGHTQAQTTQRYAHLLDDPLRQATERVGALVSPTQSAEVINLREGRKL